MMLNPRKSNSLLKLLNSSFIDMPIPLNISFMWNFGSLLGICFMTQIITGLLVATYYSSSMEFAFFSVIHLCRDVKEGCLIRVAHANGASMFFILMYLHIFRGLYYGSFIMVNTWMVGVSIFLATMGTAFLGYVLPWGQMSFWGATVITNLMSTLPYVGSSVVQWLWGGFAVDQATLVRFFAFHFILPFVILALIVIHILFLHEYGSTNPLGFSSAHSKISFHPFFTMKDSLGVVLVGMSFTLILYYYPYKLGDPENFNLANPLSTPPHIQPEWYYLFAYAILRSIPNKLGGVVALGTAVLILYLVPMLKYNNNSMKNNFLGGVSFWFFLSTGVTLTYIGANPVEVPYILYGQFFTILYFGYFLFPFSIKFLTAGMGRNFY